MQCLWEFFEEVAMAWAKCPNAFSVRNVGVGKKEMLVSDLPLYRSGAIDVVVFGGIE